MPVQTRRVTKALTNTDERAAISRITKLQVLTVHTNISNLSLCSSCFGSPLSRLSDEDELVSNGDLFASLFEGSLSPLPSEMLVDIDNVPPHALPPPLTTDSTFESIFDGPLTPLPSDMEETDDHSTVSSLPPNLVEDKALTLASQSARKKFGLNRPGRSLFDETNNLLHFHAPTLMEGGVQGDGLAPTHAFLPSASSLTETVPTPTPPLLMSIRHWRMGSGGLKPVFDDDDETHELDVVARESKKLIKQKEELMQTLKLNAVDTGTRDELTMEEKIALIQKALEVKKNALGPEGTEIIHDEIDYPMQPVDKQSTSTQMFPTEAVIT